MSAMMQNLLEKFLFKIINFIERYNRLSVSTIMKMKRSEKKMKESINNKKMKMKRSENTTLASQK